MSIHETNILTAVEPWWENTIGIVNIAFANELSKICGAWVDETSHRFSKPPF